MLKTTMFKCYVKQATIQLIVISNINCTYLNASNNTNTKLFLYKDFIQYKIKIQV